MILPLIHYLTFFIWSRCFFVATELKDVHREKDYIIHLHLSLLPAPQLKEMTFFIEHREI